MKALFSKHLFTSALFVTSLCLLFSCSSTESGVPASTNEIPLIKNNGAPIAITDDATATAIVKDMGIGINLGNTLESCGDWITNKTVSGYETAWGSPVITENMIKGYAAAGFRSIRIPVAWSNLMSTDGNYTINTALMKRVTQIVDWANKNNMYAIVNIHYDGGWWSKFPTDWDTCLAKYKAVWTQIAANFKAYDNKVIFESLNEEGCWDTVWNHYGSSTTGKSTAYGYLNTINQTFTTLVRESGGHNATRLLLIAGYGTDISLTCDSLFKMPTDSANKCAVSVHYYTPASFAILEKDADWGTCATTWGTATEKAELAANFAKMNKAFQSKGIPVIVGEYGCPTKNKKTASVELFLSSVCKAAYDYGMCPVLWDITNLHYNRTTCSMIDSTLALQLRTIASYER